MTTTINIASITTTKCLVGVVVVIVDNIAEADAAVVGEDEALTDAIIPLGIIENITPTDDINKITCILTIIERHIWLCFFYISIMIPVATTRSTFCI
jgi:hypothetical protein